LPALLPTTIVLAGAKYELSEIHSPPPSAAARLPLTVLLIRYTELEVIAKMPPPLASRPNALLPLSVLLFRVTRLELVA
jgi:hypothetical protein